jgi:TolB protein
MKSIRMAHFGALVLAIAALCAARSSAAPAAPKTPPPGTPGLACQLTHSANIDPSLAPDGARMVYISIVAGREQLFVADIDGAHPTQITRDDWDHEDPSWSPIGEKIAFVSLRDKGEVISLMNPDGTGQEALSPPGVRGIHPNWTPDGRNVVYCTDDDLAPPAKNPSDIVIVDVATRASRTIITGGVNTYPSVSPDGKRIAFRRIIGEMNSEVFAANIDGSEPRNLTSHWAFAGWPSWSPDGAQIAFASNRRSSYQIYVMRADGSDVRRVGNTEGRATAPVWARDGRTLYFTICRNVDFGSDCQIYVAPVPPLTPPP